MAMHPAKPPAPAPAGPCGKPASAPDVIPPRPAARPEPGSESDGSNATQDHPDPKADQRPRSGQDGHAPRGPYTTGNT